MRWKTYRDITRDLHTTPPFSASEYSSLIDAIPAAWLVVVSEAAKLQREHPTWDVHYLIRRSPLPVGTWVQTADGLVGQIIRHGPQALHAFSGRAGRSDGLAAYLAKAGIRCEEIDTVIDSKRHDLLDDGVFDAKLRAAQAGQFQFGFFGTPCSTFSVARISDNPQG